ncbi:MAG: UbiA-like polyprenyltransferase [Vicinamibacteria bacterium]
MGRLATYSRFVKIEHTLFSFPMLLSGALLARGELSIRTLVLILAAGTGARTAAFGLNRILDRAIDGQNPRTQKRELPSRAMSTAEAWGITGAGIVSFLLAAYGISLSCLALAPIPLVVFLVYPLLKRFTMWAHLGVGAALAMGPLGAWFAVQLDFQDFGNALLLCLFTFFWVAGFDITYATLDIDFDRARGLHSLPARLGRGNALRISLLFHLAAFLFLALLYVRALEGPIAAILLVLLGGLLYLEHRKAGDVELAFFKINAVVGFVVLGFIATGLKFPTG